MKTELPSIDEVAAQVKAQMAPKGEAAAPVVETPVAAEPVVEAPEVTEEVAEPVVETPAKAEPMGSKFAALSKREKEIQAERKKLEARQKQMEEQLKAKEAELERKAQEAEARYRKLTEGKNPLDILNAAGFKYEDATMAALGGYKPKDPEPWEAAVNPVAQTVEEIKRQNEQLAQELRELREAEKAREQQKAYQEWYNAVKKQASENAEKYEFINKFGDEAIDVVRETMVQLWQRDGVFPDYEEALELVESHYERQAETFLGTNKLKSKFAPTTEPVKPVSKPQASVKVEKPKEDSKPAEETVKTLTAAMSASSDATIDLDKLSKREALEHLAKRLKFS